MVGLGKLKLRDNSTSSPEIINWLGLINYNWSRKAKLHDNSSLCCQTGYLQKGFVCWFLEALNSWNLIATEALHGENT